MLDEAQRKVGELVVEAKLPAGGAMKSSSYEGDGYAIIRHPEDDVVLSAVKTIIETMRTSGDLSDETAEKLAKELEHFQSVFNVEEEKGLAG